MTPPSFLQVLIQMFIRYLTIRKKVDGKWKIHIDFINDNPKKSEEEEEEEE